jgi:hypothetical protein
LRTGSLDLKRLKRDDFSVVLKVSVIVWGENYGCIPGLHII